METSVSQEDFKTEENQKMEEKSVYLINFFIHWEKQKKILKITSIEELIQIMKEPDFAERVIRSVDFRAISQR